MFDHTFTAQQILELVPMGYPSLSDLVRRGVIVPSKRRGVGRGTPSLFDTFDLVGIATVAFIRPKATSTAVMAALYAFWHSPLGRRVVESALESRTVRGVVVINPDGRVSYEEELSVAALFETQKASMLHVINPHAVIFDLFSEFALKRMTEPLPSGHLPRRKRPTTQAEERGPKEPAPTRARRERLPALMREPLQREGESTRHVRKKKR